MQMDLGVPSSRHRSCLSSWHPEHQCSDLAGLPGLHHCSSSCFLLPPNEPNTVHPCVFSSQCVLFCTCRWPFQNVKAVGILESFTCAEKSSVDGKFGAFSLVLGQTHTDSKFLLGMNIGALVVKVACKLNNMANTIVPGRSCIMVSSVVLCLWDWVCLYV